MVGEAFSFGVPMTLVGDIAPQTGYWAPTTWDNLIAHLPARRGWRLTSLYISARAAEVMELASNTLQGRPPPCSARLVLSRRNRSRDADPAGPDQLVEEVSPQVLRRALRPTRSWGPCRSPSRRSSPGPRDPRVNSPRPLRFLGLDQLDRHRSSPRSRIPGGTSTKT